MTVAATTGRPSLTARDVTVIIPARDAAATLERCIGSMRGTEPNGPMLTVVDDGSTDGTGEVATGLGAAVIRTEGIGPGAARNVGVGAATTTLVAFCDADDEWSPGRLAHDLAQFDANPGLDVLLGTSWYETSEPELLDGHHFVGDEPVALIPHFGAATMRADVFERAGEIDGSLANYEDYEFFYRLRDLGLSVASHERVVQVRHLTGGSLSHRRPPEPGDLLAIMRRSVRRRRDLGGTTAGTLSSMQTETR